jgi:hypothetical protein
LDTKEKFELWLYNAEKARIILGVKLSPKELQVIDDSIATVKFFLEKQPFNEVAIKRIEAETKILNKYTGDYL